MATPTKEDILAAIEAIRTSTATGSITPSMEASALTLLLDRLEALAAELDGKTVKEMQVCMANNVSFRIRAVMKDGTRSTPCLLANPQDGNAGILTYDDYLLLRHWAVTLSKAGGEAFTPARLGDDGRLPESVMPANYGGSAELAFRAMFDAAVEDGYPYTDLETDATGSVTELDTNSTNGYHAGYEKPYRLYGFGFTYKEALRIFGDRWMPGSGGMQLTSKANIPTGAKYTDSNLDLSYTCCNNASPEVICLGRWGWDSTIAPLNLFRFCHGAANIKAIVGIIDMRYIKTSVQGMFVLSPNTGGSSKLSRFLIANVPGCIDTLDLSSCGAISRAFTYYTREGAGYVKKETTALKYLAENVDKELETPRSEKLVVKIPQSSYYSLSDSFEIAPYNKLVFCYDNAGQGKTYYSDGRTPTAIAAPMVFDRPGEME